MVEKNILEENMETILQISVDDNVLLKAQEIATGKDKTVPELINEYLLSITKKRPKEVKTLEDLYEALAESRKQIENGQIVSEEVIMKKIRRYAGIDDV